jgi:hypothetical protein
MAVIQLCQRFSSISINSNKVMAPGSAKQGSISFLKKRNKKLLLCWLTRQIGTVSTKQVKVFWFFFSKKNCFHLPSVRARPQHPLMMATAESAVADSATDSNYCYARRNDGLALWRLCDLSLHTHPSHLLKRRRPASRAAAHVPVRLRRPRAGVAGESGPFPRLLLEKSCDIRDEACFQCRAPGPTE